MTYDELTKYQLESWTQARQVIDGKIKDIKETSAHNTENLSLLVGALAVVIQEEMKAFDKTPDEGK